MVFTRWPRSYVMMVATRPGDVRVVLAKGLVLGKSLGLRQVRWLKDARGLALFMLRRTQAQAFDGWYGSWNTTGGSRVCLGNRDFGDLRRGGSCSCVHILVFDD